MDLGTIILLVGSGIVVGVINTFAGAAAVITISLYSLLGLPIGVANATNRISVIFQTVTMSVGFMSQGMLDWKLGLRLAIPTIIGAVIGTEFVSRISSVLFVWLLTVVLVMLFVMLVFDPTKALKGRDTVGRPTWVHYMILVAIGFYGGAFHVGVGYLFLALLIMGMGYNLLQANALKGFIVLGYTVFSLALFAMNGEVQWGYGLIHGSGNIIGAYFATRYSRYIPVAVLRYALMVFIGLTIIYLMIEKI